MKTLTPVITKLASQASSVEEHRFAMLFLEKLVDFNVAYSEQELRHVDIAFAGEVLRAFNAAVFVFRESIEMPKLEDLKLIGTFLMQFHDGIGELLKEFDVEHQDLDFSEPEVGLVNEFIKRLYHALNNFRDIVALSRYRVDTNDRAIYSGLAKHKTDISDD